MVEGFKDKKKKFHPTGKQRSGVSSEQVLGKNNNPEPRFNITLTKEVGLPRHLGGTDSAIVEFKKNTANTDFQVSVDGFPVSFLHEDDARKDFDQIKTKEDAEVFLDKLLNRDRNPSDSGEIPPLSIFNKDRLTKHDDRYFLVETDSMGNLSVDEYTKKAENDFKFKRHIIFTQGSEQTTDLLDVTGGFEKTEFGLELADEKKFLEGLDSSGALEESNFGDT